MNKNFFLLGALLALNVSLAARDFSVLDFGAKGDGVTLDTVAIQSTIDAAAKAGPNSRVVIPRWRHFLTGTLMLRGGIDFHLNGELTQGEGPAVQARTKCNGPLLRVHLHVAQGFVVVGGDDHVHALDCALEGLGMSVWTDLRKINPLS